MHISNAAPTCQHKLQHCYVSTGLAGDQLAVQEASMHQHVGTFGTGSRDLFAAAGILCYDTRTAAGWAQHHHARRVKSLQNLSVVPVLELLSAAAVLPLLLAKQQQPPPADLALLVKALAQLLMMRLDAHHQR